MVLANPIGVIQEFAHPPWGILSRELIGTFGPGPVLASLTRIRGAVNVDAYGLAWSVSTAPAGAGRRVRAVTTYEDQFLQIAVLYTELLGNTFFGEVQNVQIDGQYFMWQQPTPTAVDIWIFPNFSVTLYWLVSL